MLFKLLRQVFQDSEFEQTRIELAEARKVLSEYKDIVQHQAQKVEEDREKPDVEFIALLWASIGFAMAVARNAFGEAPNDVMAINTPQEAIWLAIALTMMMFIILNILFAIDLTKKYASFKADKGYQGYSQTLSIGIIIVIIGTSLLAIFDGLP